MTGFYLCPTCHSSIVSTGDDKKLFCSVCQVTLWKKDATAISESRFRNIIKFNKDNNIGKSDA